MQLPSRGRASLGARKPQAKVVLDPDGSAEEVFKVPAAVGRALAAVCEKDSEVESRAELLYLIGVQARHCARERILRMIERRDHSAQEARNKLAQDGYGMKVRTEAVAYAQEIGLIDDMRFADAFIRTKVLSGWGSLRIERELKQRGIDIQEVESWPVGYLEEDERDRAYALAARRTLSKRLSYESCARFLASRGFSPAICSSVASQIKHEAQLELEEAEGES